MPVQKHDKAALGTSWLIEDIVDGPKLQVVNGRTKKYYKVRWSDSFEPEGNIPSKLISDYENRTDTIKVLGPIEMEDNQFSEVIESNNSLTLKDSPSRRQKLLLTDRTQFAVEVDGEVSILTYKEVKTIYKNELLEYYENRVLMKQKSL